MEVKHTPGPWFVTGHMTLYVEARIIGGLIQEIAACGPTDADGGYGEQQKANAHLIAAAPELLEALESVLENCLDSDGLAAAYEKARTAIRKAKGEEQ